MTVKDILELKENNQVFIKNARNHLRDLHLMDLKLDTLLQKAYKKLIKDER